MRLGVWLRLSEPAIGRLANDVIAERGNVRVVGLRRIYRRRRYIHATTCPVNVAPDADAEAVVDDLPCAEVYADLVDTLDRNDVAQKEHGLLIEVHDHAGLLQWLRVRWLVGTIRPGERSIAGQRDHLPLVLSRWRVIS